MIGLLIGFTLFAPGYIGGNAKLFAAAALWLLASFPVNEKIGQIVRSGKQILKKSMKPRALRRDALRVGRRFEKNVCRMIKLKLNRACLI